MELVANLHQGNKSLYSMSAMLHQTSCGHYRRWMAKPYWSKEYYSSVEAATKAISGDVYCCFVCLEGKGRHLTR